LGLLRADPQQPDEATLMNKLISHARGLMQPQDVLVCDGGFELEQLLAKGIARFILKVAKNFTARRATPPDYSGTGRPPKRGQLVRPLARTFKGRQLAATPSDRSLTWSEDGYELRADFWDNLVLRNTPADTADAPTFSVVAIHDPRWSRPLLLVLATSLVEVAAADVRRLYLDRWPIEQLPLAAKQMIGAQRAFVYAVESCQRLPELLISRQYPVRDGGHVAGYPHWFLGSATSAHPRTVTTLPVWLRLSGQFQLTPGNSPKSRQTVIAA
jgi:hypothetical protein